MSNKTPYSYHIFLFPFKWEVNTSSDLSGISIDERCDLEKIKKCIPGDIWDEFSFKIETSASGNTYNELSYFYDHVRPILSLDLNKNNHSADAFSAQYTCKLDKKSKPQYEIKIIGLDKPIYLGIDEITLNLYKTGIGMLSFFLVNDAVSDFNTILKINEYGRRIYPQFLDQDDHINDSSNKLTTGTKYNFLPDEITLRNVLTLPNEVNVTENFSHYDTYNSIEKVPFILPGHLKSLLGRKFKTRYENAEINDILITPIIDDRMYVMSYLSDTETIAKMSVYDDAQRMYAYQCSEEWYRYLFIDDSAATCANRDMLRKLIDESSYSRWIEKIKKNQDSIEHQGSLWGSSRYSLVVLVADCWFNNNLLLNHFKTMYFQLVLLSITQRASALSYSDEASRLAQRIKRMPVLKEKEIKQFSDLQQSFLVFKSVINIHEVTAQEQGIELYNLIRNRMNVEQEVEYLQHVIESLNEYVQSESENSRSIESHKLTQLATWFLPASFFASLFGISFIDSKDSFWGFTRWNKIIITWVLIAGIGIIISFLLTIISKTKRR